LRLALKQPIRPSVKELTGKLKEAHALLCNQEGLFADPGKVVGELNALAISDSKEVWDLLKIILPEIRPDHYTGGKPPQKSYEKSIEGKELFAFSWDCQHLSKKMYLKFAIKGDRFVYVSLHEDRPPKERKLL
jgi:hypothetical protein